MNPKGYPSASVPLQGVPYGQPEGPGMVQHTTVNIITEPPNDHIIWSIFNLFYMNPCCLGLAALIHSVKARDRKVVGDLQGAQHYGSTARSLNITATVLICLFVVILIIVYSVMAGRISASIHNSYGRSSSYDFNYRG